MMMTTTDWMQVYDGTEAQWETWRGRAYHDSYQEALTVGGAALLDLYDQVLMDVETAGVDLGRVETADTVGRYRLMQARAQAVRNVLAERLEQGR